MLMLLLSISVYSADPANGEAIYNKKCVTCHNRDGFGKKSQKAPRLAGQYDWYIASQIKAIRDKKRVAGAASKMWPFVKQLSDAEIDDLSAYISNM